MHKTILLRIDVGFWDCFRTVSACFNAVSNVYRYAISMCINDVYREVFRMTMRAIAAELGISMPTLYRKLKAEGVDLASLRDNNGGITAAGASLIASLFDSSVSDTAVQAALHGRVNDVRQDVSLDTLPSKTALQVEAAILRERLTAAEDRLQAVTAECDRLRGERDRLLSMLEAEQRQRQLLLTDGRQRRGGLLFGLFKRNRATDTSGEG